MRNYSYRSALSMHHTKKKNCLCVIGFQNFFKEEIIFLFESKLVQVSHFGDVKEKLYGTVFSRPYIRNFIKAPQFQV